MKTITFVLALTGMFSLSISCNKKVSQEELIVSAVELKLAQWRETFIQGCHEKSYAAAEAYVDSVMVIYSLPTKLDTIPKPPKPFKPPKPMFRTKPDSVIVKEIEIKN